MHANPIFSIIHGKQFHQTVFHKQNKLALSLETATKAKVFVTEAAHLFVNSRGITPGLTA
jgi:hypothetical protein